MMPPVEVVLVSICVNVLAAAGCVKFSEVLVSFTESVLNLRTGDRAVVYCTRAVADPGFSKRGCNGCWEVVYQKGTIV